MKSKPRQFQYPPGIPSNLQDRSKNSPWVPNPNFFRQPLSSKENQPTPYSEGASTAGHASGSRRKSRTTEPLVPDGVGNFDMRRFLTTCDPYSAILQPRSQNTSRPRKKYREFDTSRIQHRNGFQTHLRQILDKRADIDRSLTFGPSSTGSEPIPLAERSFETSFSGAVSSQIMSSMDHNKEPPQKKRKKSSDFYSEFLSQPSAAARFVAETPVPQFDSESDSESQWEHIEQVLRKERKTQHLWLEEDPQMPLALHLPSVSINCPNEMVKKSVGGYLHQKTADKCVATIPEPEKLYVSVECQTDESKENQASCSASNAQNSSTQSMAADQEEYGIKTPQQPIPPLASPWSFGTPLKCLDD